MKDQVLKLCKRLKKCTLEDIVQFMETEQPIIETVVLCLEQEGLIQEKNGIITPAYTKKIKGDILNKNLYLMFQYRSDEEIEIILKGFCLEISPQKLQHFISVKDKCICDYYFLFRKLIYERQIKELFRLFFEKPQIGKYRKFYEKYAYFYVYNNQVFISDKLLRATLEKNYSKEEVREFKRMYCYLSRIESHNINEKYMYFRLVEYIWRHEKSFEELYYDLKVNLLNIS